MAEIIIDLRTGGDWSLEQSRTFFATAQVDGNQCSQPLMLQVAK